MEHITVVIYFILAFNIVNGIVLFVIVKNLGFLIEHHRILIRNFQEESSREVVRNPAFTYRDQILQEEDPKDLKITHLS